jgi:RNA polymerase sigma-70 factor (ECF subfamily)
MMVNPHSDLQTRPSLLLRVRDPRDDEAWRSFVALYGPLVYGHCRRRGLGRQDAEDVTQRVFAQVARSIRTFSYSREVGRFRDWLGTAVRHEVGRFFRKASRQAVAVGAPPGEDPLADVQSRADDTAWSEAFTAHVLRIALERCRPHFEGDTWRAFERVWIDRRPALEAAEEMGRPIDWVYVAKSRVLKRLWEEVQQLAEDMALPGQPGEG